MYTYKILRPATREAWLESRKKGIGSSEAGVLLGVSHFDTPIGLFLKKTGRTAPIEESEIMRAGHEFEPVVAYKYAQTTGNIIDPRSEGDWVAIDNERPFLRVSPDRIFWDKEIPEGERNYHNASILECKTTRLDISKTDYPASWFYQVQYQMGVMGIRKAVIAWITSLPYLHFDCVEVPFNESIYEEMTEAISDFWLNHVLADVMPETVLNASDASILWPNANPDSVTVASDEIVSLVNEYNGLSPRQKQIEDRLEEIKQEVRIAMRDTEELRTQRGQVLVTWKNTKAADRFDKDRFALENPSLYEQYVSPVSSRRMLFRKPAKADPATTLGSLAPAVVGKGILSQSRYFDKRAN